MGVAFGRQSLWIEARAGTPQVPPHLETTRIEEKAALFALASDDRVARWRRELAAVEESGSRAGVWGAGSKGVTFLNLFRESLAIAHVIDVNPHKAGMHVSGTGHRIAQPHSLKPGGAPDLLIVMNPRYLHEIRSIVAELGIAPEFRVA